MLAFSKQTNHRLHSRRFEFRPIRSTPTEMQLTSENDLECFARTGVYAPGTMFLNSRGLRLR